MMSAEQHVYEILSGGESNRVLELAVKEGNSLSQQQLVSLLETFASPEMTFNSTAST